MPWGYQICIVEFLKTCTGDYLLLVIVKKILKYIVTENFFLWRQGVSVKRGVGVCLFLRLGLELGLGSAFLKKKIDPDPGPCPDYHHTFYWRFTHTPSSMWPSCLIYCLHLWRKVKALRIQKFQRSHFSVFKSNLLVHIHPDSLWVRQLICQAIFGSCEIFIAMIFINDCFTDEIVLPSTISLV